MLYDSFCSCCCVANIVLRTCKSMYSQFYMFAFEGFECTCCLPVPLSIPLIYLFLCLFSLFLSVYLFILPPPYTIFPTILILCDSFYLIFLYYGLISPSPPASSNNKKKLFMMYFLQLCCMFVVQCMILILQLFVFQSRFSLTLWLSLFEKKKE